MYMADDMSFKYKLCACTLSTDRRAVSTDTAGSIGMKYSLYTYARNCIAMGRTIVSINLADNTRIENALDTYTCRHISMNCTIVSVCMVDSSSMKYPAVILKT
jgi:hypothetical protein